MVVQTTEVEMNVNLVVVFRKNDTDGPDLARTQSPSARIELKPQLVGDFQYSLLCSRGNKRTVVQAPTQWRCSRLPAWLYPLWSWIPSMPIQINPLGPEARLTSDRYDFSRFFRTSMTTANTITVDLLLQPFSPYFPVLCLSTTSLQDWGPCPLHRRRSGRILPHAKYISAQSHDLSRCHSDRPTLYR